MAEKQNNQSTTNQQNMDPTSKGTTGTQTGGAQGSTGLGSKGGTSSAAGGIGSGTSAASGSTPSTGSGQTGFTGNTTSTGGGTGAATARSFMDQAKETAGQAYDAVTETAATKLDERKSTLSGGLATVADSVRQVGNNLESSKTESGLAESAAKYTQTAAGKIEDLAGYFETRSVRDMARDLEGFARRNPAVFLGAAFGLGVLAARFFKSTAPGGPFGQSGQLGTAGRNLSSGTQDRDRITKPTGSTGGSTKNTSSVTDFKSNPM